MILSHKFLFIVPALLNAGRKTEYGFIQLRTKLNLVIYKKWLISSSFPFKNASGTE